MRFQANLDVGRTGETVIANWFKAKGGSVLPVYEKIIDEGKGPQLFTYDQDLVAPDMVVFTKRRIMWVEAKTKSGFTWYRISQRWTTGIDSRHFWAYVRVRERTGVPLWILFLQQGGETKDAPQELPNPSGLFGAEINSLVDNIDHTSPKHAKGMVYWARQEDGGPLIKYAEINEFERGMPWQTKMM